MTTEQTAQDPDVGFEDGHVNVDIKVSTLKDETHNPLELCLVAHDSEGVKSVNQRQGVAVGRIGC